VVAADQQRPSSLRSGVTFQEFDLTDHESISRLSQYAVEQLGTVDILTNTAAIGSGGEPVEEVSIESWREILDINLTGAFVCAQSFGRAMVSKHQGKIINFASFFNGGGFPYRCVDHCRWR
jgi:NAD(P)-dependent dehydrogenase (short-subunit alcohol dehydrogenase family)